MPMLAQTSVLSTSASLTASRGQLVSLTRPGDLPSAQARTCASGSYPLGQARVRSNPKMAAASIQVLAMLLPSPTQENFNPS